MRTRIVVALFSLSTVYGCAGIRLSLPQPDTATRVELVTLFNRPMEPARGIPPYSRLDIVNRVDERVRLGALTVCQRTFNDPDNCLNVLGNRTLTIDSYNEESNASVDRDFHVIVLGGLVRDSGTDDEIALALAHEYAHGMFGHVATSQANEMWGQVLGGLAGIAVGTAVGADAATVVDLGAQGATISEGMGWTAFSKDMELEADHLALFIVNEAGYDMDKGMQFFQREIQIQRQYNAAGRQRVGFFDTHPADEERLLRLMAAKDMIEQGADRPLWKP